MLKNLILLVDYATFIPKKYFILWSYQKPSIQNSTPHQELAKRFVTFCVKLCFKVKYIFFCPSLFFFFRSTWLLLLFLFLIQMSLKIRFFVKQKTNNVHTTCFFHISSLASVIQTNMKSNCSAKSGLDVFYTPDEEPDASLGQVPGTHYRQDLGVKFLQDLKEGEKKAWEDRLNESLCDHSLFKHMSQSHRKTLRCWVTQRSPTTFSIHRHPRKMCGKKSNPRTDLSS